TDAFATVFDLTGSKGMHGSLGIKNTGGANSLNWRTTYTSIWTGTGTGTGTLGPGASTSIALDTQTTPLQPYNEVKLEVQSTTPGSATTYQSKISFIS